MLPILSIFILLIPFTFALNPTSTIDLQLLRILGPVVILLWLATGLVKRKLTLDFSMQSFFLLAFFILSALSLSVAEETAWGVRKVIFLVSFLPLFFVVSDLCRQQRTARRNLATVIAISGGLAAVIGLGQFLLQFLVGLNGALEIWRSVAGFFLGENLGGAVVAYNSWLVHVGGIDLFRAIGFFPDPHMYAFFLGLTLPFALWRGMTKKNPWLLLCAGLILLVDLLTFTRGAYVGLLGGGIAWLLYAAKSFSQTKRFLIGAGAMTLLAILLIPNPVTQRFLSSFSGADGSVSERIVNLQQATELIVAQPFTGVGIGNYATAIDPTADYRTPIYAHNLYLDIAADSGIFAALAWVSFMGFVFLGFLKHTKKPVNFGIAGMVSITILSTHALFDTPLYSVQVLPLLMVIAGMSMSGEEE